MHIKSLSSKLLTFYIRVCQHKTLIVDHGEKLIVCCKHLNGASQVGELIQKGYAYRRTIGRRSALVLGSWTAEETLLRNGCIVSGIFTDEMIGFLGRYSEADQGVLETTFRLFASVRKSGTVASSVLLRQLKAYERYPVDVIMEGLRIYCNGDFAERGMKEEYALGIIRGVSRDRTKQPDPVAVEQVSNKQQLIAKQLVSLRVSERELQSQIDAEVLRLVLVDGHRVQDLSVHKLAIYRQRAEQELTAKNASR